MDYSKLLFAAEVSKYGHKFYEAEMKIALADTENSPGDFQRWVEAHPFDTYLKRAYDELMRVSAVIDGFESDERKLKTDGYIDSLR